MDHWQNFSRRDFIKISSLFLAGSAAMSSSAGQAFSGLGQSGSDENSDRIVYSFCEHCFWRCGIAAHVRDGKVYKIVGSEHHPSARANSAPEAQEESGCSTIRTGYSTR